MMLMIMACLVSRSNSAVAVLLALARDFQI
jgi:hypothetical protein